MNHEQIIQDAIRNSELFVAKLKDVLIQEDKYLAVFTETMMGVKSEGGKAIFTDEPYSFEYAKVYCKSIVNGHGQYPEIMEHREYIERCIEQQEKHIASLRAIEVN